MDSSEATSARRQSAQRVYRLSEFFELSEGDRSESLLASTRFSRRRSTVDGGGEIVRDDFENVGDTCCLFVRLRLEAPAIIRLVADRTHRVVMCAAGGWLLESDDEAVPCYWLPRLPVLRTTDIHGRIVEELAPSIAGVAASATGFAVSIAASAGYWLDLVAWRISSEACGLREELQHLYSLEKARTLLWSSQATYGLPAELYLSLIHGHFYQNARAWPRNWKFCSELDAYEVFTWMRGLELGTGKRLYGLLRRQILLSVMARQAADGGWHHGEWTDSNECHYRFHNGALLLLENALEEWNDESIRQCLAKGAEFVASRTDTTDLGTWFLHDSLEQSAEALDDMYRQTGAIVKGFGAWKPTRFLGKSPTNKLILNTHVDTTVVLDRYSHLCSDDRFRGQLESAVLATRRLLELRPAEFLYRAAFRAVRWTLLPAARAARLPLPIRVLKRLTWMHLLPNLHRLKHARPRIVMPGGFIDRHLSPPHFDAKYHAVNVLDLVRLLRQFPDEQLERIVEDAIHFVLGNEKSTLLWWSEAPPRRFALVVFAEALYHLCILKRPSVYRRYLAEVLLFNESIGLGLPPSLLGGNAEITPVASQAQLPIPVDERLRVANLGTIDRPELLVINPTSETIELTWETGCSAQIAWEKADTGVALPDYDRPAIPPSTWIWGKPLGVQ
jgi:hypothetical protein